MGCIWVMLQSKRLMLPLGRIWLETVVNDKRFFFNMAIVFNLKYENMQYCLLLYCLFIQYDIHWEEQSAGVQIFVYLKTKSESIDFHEMFIWFPNCIVKHPERERNSNTGKMIEVQFQGKCNTPGAWRGSLRSWCKYVKANAWIGVMPIVQGWPGNCWRWVQWRGLYPKKKQCYWNRQNTRGNQL